MILSQNPCKASLVLKTLNNYFCTTIQENDLCSDSDQNVGETIRLDFDQDVGKADHDHDTRATPFIPPTPCPMQPHSPLQSPNSTEEILTYFSLLNGPSQTNAVGIHHHHPRRQGFGFLIGLSSH